MTDVETRSSSRVPWPVAPPAGQEGKGPTVMEVPLADHLDFGVTMGPRIAGNFALGLAASTARALVGKWPLELNDHAVLDLHLDTVFCRFVTTTLDPADERAFAKQLERRRPDETWFKIDFSAMQKLRMLRGIYAAPVVALGCIREDGHRELVAMRISGMVLKPRDKNAWALARLFLMQGAALHGVLVQHYSLHFQFDAIAAVTASVLPPEHPVRRLLQPHFRFLLPLNQAALHSELSILTNNPLLPFAGFPCTRESVHRFQSTGWTGIEGNSAYPAYRFQRRPEGPFGDLGVFLKTYYDVFHTFVNRALAGLSPADPLVARWADEIARWIPGFPDAAGMAAPGVLAEVVAACMWGASVVHSTEHHGLVYDVPLAAIPLRLRIPPPFTREIPDFDRRSLTTRSDAWRQLLAWDVLVKGRPVTRLDRVSYGFAEPELRRANAEFVTMLQETNRNPTLRRFAPLESMAVGIQF